MLMMIAKNLNRILSLLFAYSLGNCVVVLRGGELIRANTVVVVMMLVMMMMGVDARNILLPC